MKKVLPLLLLFMLLASPCFAEDVVNNKAPKSQGQVFAVIFGVTIGNDGSLSNLRIDKVIDASSGSQESVDINVSQEYFENAKTKIINYKYKPSLENGKPKEFYTYFYLDLNRPTVVVDDADRVKR